PGQLMSRPQLARKHRSARPRLRRPLFGRRRPTGNCPPPSKSLRVAPIRIADPYAVPGRYWKAQLHCHTTNSDGKFDPRGLLERYREAGYTFVVLTDHERLTVCDDLNDATFLAVPGVETAVGRPFRPLGPHLGRLGMPGALDVRGAQACIDATVAA